MKRIDRLTDKQIARFPEWVDKWIRIGLSTEPANFDAAIEGVRGCYHICRLKQPQVLLRMGSPYSAVLGGAMSAVLLWSQVRSQVESQVESQVWSQVESQVWSQVWSQVGSVINQYRGGSLWAGWYAYIAFLRDCCGWENDSLAAFAYDEQHAVNAGWCWYHDLVASLSDRPRALHRNSLGQLHCENGMAARWPDGWGIWSLSGVLVDEQIVMRPETQTLEQIAKEGNEEVRRVRIERFGWDRYLRDTGAKPRDRRRNDRDAQTEELYQLADGTQRFLCVDPSTGRKYALGVPRDVTSCEQAQNWMSSGLDQYAIHRS